MTVSEMMGDTIYDIHVAPDTVHVRVILPDKLFVDDDMETVLRRKLDEAFRDVAKKVVGDMYNSFLEGINKHV